MPSGMPSGLVRHSAKIDWIDDPRPQLPMVRPAERGADVYYVRRWCETPAEAPLPMEARAFELVSPRDVLRAVFGRVRRPAGSDFVKAAGAGLRA